MAESRTDRMIERLNQRWVEADKIARAFHAAYEELAPDHGYETREESAKPWDEVPAANRDLMVDTVARLLTDGVIRAPDSRPT